IYSQHLDLYSFPTRRSSDLIGFGKNFSVGFNMSYLFGNLKQVASADYSERYVGFLNSRREINNSVGGLNFDFGAQYVANLNNARSEEHTSELQSRENLVCRL